ncbi:phosphatase PAP2 family protein [Acinetobacter sp. ANC 4558]|uniref:phosphatase PAP2 family protein n=1 Tax=Acinetobacter sp. ANC 4558 TaxID=1977876 RepID=UPI001D171B98|nr:phosphatase PAP2 family protein [Acinetobacter sp. ANC 4558]
MISKSRPPEMYHLVEVFGSSFPSAHSAYAAAIGCLAIYTNMQSPKYRMILLCSVIWMIVMGVSRIYLGVHYPSDVLAGWGMSLVYVSVIYLIFIKLDSTKFFSFR